MPRAAAPLQLRHPRRRHPLRIPNCPSSDQRQVARITDIAQRHNVPIKAAALQFSLAHPATAAVIPGASKPERIAEDYAALNTTIPDDFWHEMRDQHLVADNAPLPIDR